MASASIGSLFQYIASTTTTTTTTTTAAAATTAATAANPNLNPITE